MKAALALQAAWRLAQGIVLFAWYRSSAATARRTDAALLILFGGRHYVYPYLPEAWWGDTFAAAGSIGIIALVLLVRPWLPLAAWIVGEEALVAGCSIWWLADPWIVTGGEQCSSRLGFKLGSIGLVALALIAWRMSGLTGRQQEAGNGK